MNGLMTTVTIEKQDIPGGHQGIKGGKNVICKMPRLEVTCEARENRNKQEQGAETKAKGFSFFE